MLNKCSIKKTRLVNDLSSSVCDVLYVLTTSVIDLIHGLVVIFYSYDYVTLHEITGIFNYMTLNGITIEWSIWRSRIVLNMISDIQSQVLIVKSIRSYNWCWNL